ncbi:ATP-binding cassette domain-containing protein [Microvirga sp. SRT01]|uniref:ATP-binding cassette domain-containing protein n=1 Tax=Sphingomonas longa TaxID=2778730 RepID=A0ABS2D4F8_9SPHN|nr:MULTISPECIES: ATP-binding cassette domain-containing protein [Alphaproteobacteria]MBM6575463.1 ATP-binding cassette domain-containing protein [Sphingomonas sp. BT552]MBR7708511.1 ATP-binding cassette domain-containing protein [Microvirga sp. SRT01]
MNPSAAPGSSLRAMLGRSRRAGAAVAALTFGLTLLPVAAALYLMMLFDVALASRSGATIGGIVAMMLGGIGLAVGMARLRTRLLARIGANLFVRAEEQLARAMTQAADPRTARRAITALNQLQTIRAFIAGRGVVAFLDLAVLPVALPVLLCLGVWLAVAWLIAASVMTALLVRATTAARTAHAAREDAATESVLDVGDPVLLRALGMHDHAAAARRRAGQRTAALAQRVDLAAGRRHITGAMLALLGWVVAIAVGSVMAIYDAASVGAIAAAAFVTQRSLVALAGAMTTVDSLAETRATWRHVDSLLAALPHPAARLPLPAPTRSLTVDTLSLVVQETRRVILREIGFDLSAGDVLVVAGPMAAGKSALLRALVGGWTPTVGKIRLDGGTLDQWEASALAHHIGYLPQSAELYEGTVAQNIAAFDPAADPAAVLAAARAAGIHDMIVRLPRGYDTIVGPFDGDLSAGERQRIALARALHGDPFVVVLDDPAAHADAESHAALAAAIRGVRARGGIVVAVGHAAAMIDEANLLLLLRAGRMQDFGPKDEVRRRLAEARAANRQRQQTPELATAKE